VSPIRFITAAAVAASLALPLAAAAQQAPPPPAAPAAAGAPAPRHGAHYMRALRSLNLTDAQKAQIKTAMQQTRQANENADPQTRKTNLEQLRAQINSVLTPDQRAQLQAELQKEREDAANAPAGGAAPPPHN
jgi:Spy/CpxP family protein refolding chaperone